MDARARFFDGIGAVQPCLIHGNLDGESAVLVAPKQEAASASVEAKESKESKTDHIRVRIESDRHKVGNRRPSERELSRVELVDQLTRALLEKDPTDTLLALNLHPLDEPFYRDESGTKIFLRSDSELASLPSHVMLCVVPRRSH